MADRPAAKGSYERWTNGELRRLKGDALLARHGGGAAAQAETCYREALSIAAAQASRLQSLRAATALARLLAEQSQRDAACEILTPHVESFCSAEKRRISHGRGRCLAI